MYLYIVVESNGEAYAEDYIEVIGGVYSTLEAAKAHRPRYEDDIDHIEKWKLNGDCVNVNIEEEEVE